MKDRQKNRAHSYEMRATLRPLRFLASPSARSHNTGYTAHFVRPNFAKGGTSYSPKTLGEIVTIREVAI